MSKVFLGGRDQMMANRSSQTVIMYCSSQNFRHLWITIYGLVWDDSHLGDVFLGDVFFNYISVGKS